MCVLIYHHDRHSNVLINDPDTECYLSFVVASAVSGKNALANVYGYSPNQLVFGKNPNLPSNKLPALEKPCQSEVVEKKLNSIHSARKAFVEAEASEKLSTTPGYIFENG